MLKELILFLSLSAGVDAQLISRMIYVESRGDTFAVGRAGEIGLMQLKPRTAAVVCPGTRANPWLLYIPEVNIECGIRYLLRLEDHYGIDIPASPDAYNVGPVAWKRGIRNARYVRKVTER